jgi:glycosyltransferase involved in cell wall biosynthesis
MTRKRILIIMPDRLQKPTGGMGVGLAHTLPLLQDEFDVDVVGFPEDGAAAYYRGVSNPIPSITHNPIVMLMGQVTYMTEALRGPRPDCVHAYDWSVYVAAYHVAKHFNVPLVVTMQLSINLLGQLGMSYTLDQKSADAVVMQDALQKCELLGLEKADRIIQISNAYAAYFAAVPGLAVKTTVIPHGIDAQAWSHVTERPQLPGLAKIKVAYIGRFAPMKGIRSLCQAHIPKEIDLIFIGDATFGDATLVTMIRDKVARNSNVHLLPAMYDQDKINILNAVDAVIMPSVHEPFGIVGLEALASKSIILSSCRDGLGDFLNDEVAINCGIEALSIERAFNQLVQMSEEEKQCRIARGLEICAQYDWKLIVAKLKEVYHSVLSI